MLSRRHIRIKVMQSLYSFFADKDSEMSTHERAMIKHMNEVVELNLVIVALLIEIVKYADNFFEEGKKKYLPSADDLNPNRRFVDNHLISILRNDKGLMDQIAKVSGIWINNDHDIVRKLFKILFESDLYKKYITSNEHTLEIDQRFIVNALNEIILNNQLVHHILEERSIYWIDDLPFVATILMGQIKSKESLNPSKAFKDISDKKFAIDLFRNTIINNVEFEKMIQRFSVNWELERISIMDQLFLKMSFAEILFMKELPVKVSMNEYIEISKYYGASKSKLFINGLLDNVVRTFMKEGKIIKVGRGLV